MSASGAKVMALRSIEVARSYGVKLRVRPTFGHADGTWIGEEDEIVLEKAIVSGVTHDTSEAKIVLAGVPDRPGVAARIFRSLAEAGVNVDMIVQNVAEHGHDEHHLHDPESRRRNRRPDPRCRRRGGRRRARRARSRDREDLADRRGHEEPSRRGRRDVRRARRGRHQHRDHLDVVDPHLLRRPRRRCRAGGTRGPRSLPELCRGAGRCLDSASSGPPALSAR